MTVHMLDDPALEVRSVSRADMWDTEFVDYHTEWASVYDSGAVRITATRMVCTPYIDEGQSLVLLVQNDPTFVIEVRDSASDSRGADHWHTPTSVEQWQAAARALASVIGDGYIDQLEWH